MTVRLYRSADFGAPALNNATGGLITLLDACLINGYGDQTITITRVGTLATITTTSPHGFPQWARYDISGADQPEYNGTHDVTKVGNNTLTFEVAGSPVSPATGVITGKIGGSGWTKPYSDTNKAVYAMGGSNTTLLDVNDSEYGYITRMTGYATMDGVGSGVEAFGNTMWLKSELYNNIQWFIVATDENIYYWARITGTTSQATFHHYGVFDSNKVGDIYNVYLVGSTATTSAHESNVVGFNHSSNVATHNDRWYLPRNYLSLLPSVYCGMGRGYGGGMNFPTKHDNSLYMADLFLGNSSRLMGKIRGLTYPSNTPLFGNQQIFFGSGDLAGRIFMYFYGYGGMFYVELTDNW